VTYAKVVWAPYPYEAGFCITDDPDASTLEQTRIVYDFLMSKSFVTTKAIWAFRPVEKCGIPPIPDSALRGITLQDEQYLTYCKELHQNGFELCLHGASAGNNKRERTLDAFNLLSEYLGASDTFICHSKNAENIYWEDKITSRLPFQTVLRLYSKHSCEGELKESLYFWGDVCNKNINQIRLYRTRYTNTLKRNPSMPYFDPNKPLVNGWFSATKRSLADCATEDTLDNLKKENGLTVLYQYLHRYAQPDRGKVSEKFAESIERIVADPKILVDTVSAIMKRLRQIQSVFMVFQKNSFWILNTSDEDINNLQIITDHATGIEKQDDNVNSFERSIVIKTLPKKSILFIRVSDQIVFHNKNAIRINRNKLLVRTLPFGKLFINLSENKWQINDKIIINPCSFHIEVNYSRSGIPLLSTLSYKEELTLLTDQFSIFAREVLLRKRSPNIEKYLDSTKEIPMENHDNW
jgi:hypothetical protein